MITPPQLRAFSEIRVHFVGKIVAGIDAQALGVSREDETVQHQRIQREERTLFDDPAIELGVTISDPALAIRADASETVVVASTPDRIGVEQPERRGIGSGCKVDVEIGLFRAQFSDEMNGGVEVAVKLAARNDLVGIAGAIEFELVDAVFLNQIETRVSKVAVILGL